MLLKAICPGKQQILSGRYYERDGFPSDILETKVKF